MSVKKNKIAKIIRLTSKTTGQSYIGVTVQPVEHWITNMTVRHHPTSKIERAIRRESKENFTREILDSDKDHAFARQQLLPMYIEMHDTYKTGLNVLKGSHGIPGWIPTKKHREGMSRRQKVRVKAGILVDHNKGRRWITDGWKNRIITRRELAKGLRKPWKLGLTRRAAIFKKAAKSVGR